MDVSVLTRRGERIPAIPSQVAAQLDVKEGQYLSDDQVVTLVKLVGRKAVQPPMRLRVRTKRQA